MSDDLTDQLRRLGSDPGPAPDQGFADGLDSRLRVLHAQGGRGSAQRTFPSWMPLATVAAVVLIAAVGVSLLRSSPPAEVVMTVASDTDIYLPDDETTVGVAGLVLPEGTRIVVGPEGEAVVDGVVLSPGTEAVVVGDHIAVVATAPSERGLEDPGPPVTTDETPGRDSDSGGDNASPATTTASTTGRSSSASTSADPRPTDGPPSTPTTIERRPSTSPTSADPSTSRPVSSPTTTTSTTTTAGPPRDSVAPFPAISLTATPVGDTRIRLDWVLERVDDPAGWRVRAANGDRVVTIVALRDGIARSTTIERPTIAEATVWVEAMGPDGRVLARSNRIGYR